MEKNRIQHTYRRLQAAVQSFEHFQPTNDSLHLENVSKSVNFTTEIAMDHEGNDNPLNPIDLKHHIKNTATIHHAYKHNDNNIMNILLIFAQGILGGIGAHQVLEIITSTSSTGIDSISCIKSIFLHADASNSATFYCSTIVLTARICLLNQNLNPHSFSYNMDRMSMAISILTLILCIQTVGAEMRYYDSESSSALGLIDDNHESTLTILIILKSSFCIVGWVFLCVSKILKPYNSDIERTNTIVDER